MTGCTKTEYITRTETVEIFVPQYIDFDQTTLTPIPNKLYPEITWADAVINLSENINVCKSNIELILKTINE